jgi:hypothetical protein
MQHVYEGSGNTCLCKDVIVVHETYYVQTSQPLSWLFHAVYAQG